MYAAQLSNLKVESVTQIETASIVEIEGDWATEIELVTSVRKALPDLVWQSAGICRTKAIMERGIAQVAEWREQLHSLSLGRYVLDLAPSDRIKFKSALAEVQLRLYAETLNLLDIGYLILNSAAFRTESRGGHYRLDYPNRDPQWQVHTTVTGDKWNTSPLN